MPEKLQIDQPRLWTRDRFQRDRWRNFADDEPLRAGFSLISLQRWRKDRSELLRNPAISVGINLAPDDAIDPTRDALERVEMIVLTFPKFTDGRAYSMARRLREQWNYRGELRAAGDILYDQLPLMLRCGFDSFAISDAATIRTLERRTPGITANRPAARSDRPANDVITAHRRHVPLCVETPA